jgi:Polyketide cyclase / dehydrase and lipid transport
MPLQAHAIARSAPARGGSICSPTINVGRGRARHFNGLRGRGRVSRAPRPGGVDALFTPVIITARWTSRSHYTAGVAHHRFVVQVRAPREQVFDLWTDLDRAHEWIEGLTRITDVTGPITTAGTRYTVWFGRLRSPTEVLQVDRPRLFRTRFDSWLLRGVEQATFEDQGHGTRLTQEFWINGIISRLMGRIWASGSYRGSFRGELKSFVLLAEREARSSP